MSKRAVCNYFLRPLLDILIVYNKKIYEKTGDKIFMAKTRSNTGENGSTITWIFMYTYYYLTNAFSVSTDRGTSLALIFVGKLNLIKKKKKKRAIKF